MKSLQEAFAEWAKDQGLSVGDMKPDGRHWSSHTHLAWMAYQAGAKQEREEISAALHGEAAYPSNDWGRGYEQATQDIAAGIAAREGMPC